MAITTVDALTKVVQRASGLTAGASRTIAKSVATNINAKAKAKRKGVVVAGLSEEK